MSAEATAAVLTGAVAATAAVAAEPASSTATAAVLTGAVAATAAVAAEPASSTAAVNSMSLKNLDVFTCDEILIDEEITQVYLGRFDGRDERALVKVVSKRLALAAPERFKRMRLALRSESGAEYSYYDGELRPSSPADDTDLHPKFDVQVICPASDRQVSRFRRAEWAMVFETPECYEKATKAYIAGVVGDGSSLNWLYNVLDGKKEAERVLYSDPDPDHGFIVNIDTKWSAHPNCLEVPRDQWLTHEKMNLDGLYCLGIARKRGLASLRDLRAEHVPMLKEMYRAGLATIKDVYGVDRSKLRVFIHYLPQFFAFHMHFTSHLNQVNVLPEKAHLVPDIIQNLESDGDYYAKRTMQFSVKTDDKLYKLMEPFLEM